MGIEHTTASDEGSEHRIETAFPQPRGRTFWLHAASAGVIAGQVFAVWFQYTMDMMPALGTVFFLGAPELSFPWAIHLVDSALFGVLYAALVDSSALRPYAARSWTGAVLGGVFAALLWLVLSVLFWPFWAAMFAGNWPLPDLASVVRPGLAYVLWGMLTGGLFAEFRRL